MEPGSILLLSIIVAVTFVLSFIGAAVGLVLGRSVTVVDYVSRLPHSRRGNQFDCLGKRALWPARHDMCAMAGILGGLAMMGIPSAIGAIVAVLIFVRINPLWSYLAIGFVMLISGVQLIRRKAVDPPPGQLSLVRIGPLIEGIIGLVLGAVPAISGLMLGSLRLPMMIRSICAWTPKPPSEPTWRSVV